jgi:hypothetical protein
MSASRMPDAGVRHLTPLRLRRRCLSIAGKTICPFEKRCEFRPFSVVMNADMMRRASGRCDLIEMLWLSDSPEMPALARSDESHPARVND